MTETSRLVPLIRRLATSAVAALSVLALTLALMTYLSWQSSLLARRSRTVQFVGGRALDLALERQTSIAGYLITNDTTILTLERRARPALQHTMDSLTRLTANSPGQQSRLRQISAAIATWDRTYADRVLRSPDFAGRQRIGREKRAGVAAFALVRSGLDEFLREEASLYSSRAQRNTLRQWSGVAVLGFEGLIVLVMLMRLQRELLARAAHTVEQQSQLEEQAIELEAQAAEQELLAVISNRANRGLKGRDGRGGGVARQCDRSRGAVPAAVRSQSGAHVGVRRKHSSLSGGERRRSPTVRILRTGISGDDARGHPAT